MSQNQDIFDFDVDVFESMEAEKQIAPEQVPLVKDQQKRSQRQEQPAQLPTHHMSKQQHTKDKPKKIVNKFSLSDQQKINISKRLPKGFVLLKKVDYPQNHGTFKGQIQYIPVKKQPKIASYELLEKFPISILTTINPKKQVERKVQKPGLRLGNGQLPEGKSKQTQKVKGVLQKFRKHPKYTQLSTQLNKLGLLQGFTQIQSEIKKNIHTIDSFKDRCLFILNQAKQITSSQQLSEVINELIDEFMFQIEQAKKLQFENNLIMIQKNIDKITREITDIRESGNWYLRKKKRTEKNFDEKEVMYIADLVRQLPPAYLVGVWEIVEEKPFLQSQQKEIQINFSQLKTKKIRQIESYVKRKHNTYMTSRERKKQKLRQKQQTQSQQRSQEVKQEKLEEFPQVSKNPENENIFSVENIGLDQGLKIEQKKQQGNGILSDYNHDKKEMGHIDDFLELDELLMPDDKISLKNIEESKIPPTPRFSSLDNNPHLEEDHDNKKISDQIQQEKQVQEFQMQEPDLRIPQPIEGDSSDSSFITDDEDSDY